MTFRFEKERVTAANPDGTVMGYITFPRIRAGLVNIDQMTVFPPFRGQAVEEAMMEALLVHLQQRSLKAALSCSFAQQYLEKHPQWKTILPGELYFTKY